MNIFTLSSKLHISSLRELQYKCVVNHEQMIMLLNCFGMCMAVRRNNIVTSSSVQLDHVLILKTHSYRESYATTLTTLSGTSSVTKMCEKYNVL